MSLSIGELVGYVKLDTKGVTKGAATTRSQMSGLGKSMGGSSKMMSGALKGVGMALGGLGIAKVAGDAVSLEASFSKSMAQIRAATGASGATMEKLNKLAMKMGADTAFSASDAADAMLELGKAGISTSDIMGGALKGTMTLAAAGTLDMGAAATYGSNAMNAFGLKGKDMGKIAAALAGGANASSASVESLGQALSQVGPGAKQAGMSLQETVAALSAFDSEGVKGSDAGTSLKTMLQNLQPTSERAATAMASVGLYSKKTGSAFVKANGQFKSMSQIAGLLHTHLSGLSEAQRSQALTQIFGTDASRAAAIMMDQGAKGIRKYIKATNDQGAAQRMADANMSGTAGAIERMKGSIETAELALGKALAPAIQKAAGLVAGLANSMASGISVMQSHGDTVKLVAKIIGGIMVPALILWGGAAVTAMVKNVAAWVTTALASQTGAAAAERSAAQVAFSWAMMGAKALLGAAKVAMSWLIAMGPIAIVIAAVAGLAFLIYKHWDDIKRITAKVWGAISGAVGKAWGAIKHGVSKGVSAVIGFIRSHWKVILSILGGPFVAAVILIASHWGKIKAVVSKGVSAVVGFVKSLPGKVVGALQSLGALERAVFVKAWDLARGAVVGGITKVVGLAKGVPGKVKSAIGDLGHLLFDAGAKIIEGLIDGIGSKVHALTDKLHGITKLIPFHKGPIDKDRKLLKPAGIAIMEGLIKGLESKEGDLRDKLQAITSKIANTKSAMSSLVSDISSKFQNDAFAGDLTSFDSTVSTDTTNAKSFRAALKTAIAHGLKGGLLRGLSESGNLALAQQFAGLGRGELGDRMQAFNHRNGAAVAAGSLVSNTMYGKQLTKQTNTLQGIRDDLRDVLAEQRRDRHRLKVLQHAKAVRDAHKKSDNPKTRG